MTSRSEADSVKRLTTLQLRHDRLDRLHHAVDEPKTEARLRMLVKAGVASAVLLTGLLGALSWRMALQAAQDADWVAHAHEVSATLELTLRHLVDVETGARGFALTGHEPFLEPNNLGKTAVSLDLQALRRLVVEPDQVTRLDVLAKQANISLEEAADLVAARQQSGQTPAITRLIQGKQTMDAVRSTVEVMEDQEKLLLEQRSQRARRTRRFTSSAIGLGSVLGVIFLSIAGITVSREIRVAAHAQGQVKVLNADLERRVEQRTAALEAEAAARLESEGRLAAVIMWATDSIIMLDDQLHIALFNQAAEKMFHCPQNTALGQPITAFIPHLGKFDESDAADGAKGLHDGLWAVRADGEKFQIEASISENELAGHQMFTIILRDVTERKQAEQMREQTLEALRESEERFQALANGIPQLTWIAAADGTRYWYNQRWYEFTGTTPEEMQGLGWQSVHHLDFLPEVLARWTSAIAQGKPFEMEFPLRGKDGLFCDFLTRIVPLKDSGGRVVRWFGTNTDISGLKRTEARLAVQAEEIRKLNEDLEEKIAKRTGQLAAANQELEAFSYSVSHDLRAPLRHIAGFSKILINEFAPGMAGEAREHLERIQTAVVRMGLLVTGLLGLAKLGRQSLKLSRTDLNEVVDQVISILEPECEGRQVEWQIARLPALDCDPILMAHVFQNLLGNALKYTRGRAGTVIEVDSILQSGKPAIIFVRDNGVGFNMRYAERLFGVFQRMHTVSEFEGTGVGLATVQRIIQKHGGMIWAEAEVDHGATFYFALERTEHIGAPAKATAVS